MATPTQIKIIEVLRNGGYIRPYVYHGRFGASVAALFDANGTRIQTVRKDAERRMSREGIIVRKTSKVGNESLYILSENFNG